MDYWVSAHIEHWQSIIILALTSLCSLHSIQSHITSPSLSTVSRPHFWQTHWNVTRVGDKAISETMCHPTAKYSSIFVFLTLWLISMLFQKTHHMVQNQKTGIRHYNSKKYFFARPLEFNLSHVAAKTPLFSNFAIYVHTFSKLSKLNKTEQFKQTECRQNYFNI